MESYSTLATGGIPRARTINLLSCREARDMNEPKVLLVDCDEASVSRIRQLLAGIHIPLSVASDGDQARTRLGLDPDIDVVLLDLRIEGMENLRALEQIRETFPLVKVIVLTSMETFRAAIKCMRLGAFDYLLKTCEPEELFAKLMEAAREKHVQQQKIFASGAKALERTWREDNGLG